MVSTSGAQLLPPDAVAVLKKCLLPMATIVTPNIPEAKLLLGREKEPNPQTYEQMIQLAADLQKLGPRWVLVKGGHFKAEMISGSWGHRIVDVLHNGHSHVLIEKESLSSKNTHGTGCSLACIEAVNQVSRFANVYSCHRFKSRISIFSTGSSLQCMPLCRSRDKILR